MAGTLNSNYRMIECTCDLQDNEAKNVLEAHAKACGLRVYYESKRSGAPQGPMNYNNLCLGCGVDIGESHAIDCPVVASRNFQPGQKFDTDKPLMSLLPPHAQLAVARVLTFGARKYAPDNWRRVDDLQRRYLDAALRHLNAVQRGETDDVESGEHHYAHAICCLMFMLEDALLAEANQ